MSWRNYGRAQARRKPKTNGKPRRKPVDWEGQEQAILMRWLHGESMRGTPVGDLYSATYHVPNGGYRLGKEAGRMKAQGVKAGVSDLPVMEARGGWFGLYLEFKATPPRDAELTSSQREWLEEAEARGYCAALVLGLEEAKALLREYAGWVKTAYHQGERLALTSGTEWRKVRTNDDGSNGNAGE